MVQLLTCRSAVQSKYATCVSFCRLNRAFLQSRVTSNAVVALGCLPKLQARYSTLLPFLHLPASETLGSSSWHAAQSP